MAFNPYIGSPAASATQMGAPANLPMAQNRPATQRGPTTGPRRRPRGTGRGGPGVRRRGTSPPQPPMPNTLSRPAPIPESRLSPEGGIPGMEDIGQAAAMGRFPGVGQPGAMNRLGAPSSVRRKGRMYA